MPLRKKIKEKNKRNKHAIKKKGRKKKTERYVKERKKKKKTNGSKNKCQPLKERKSLGFFNFSIMDKR